MLWHRVFSFFLLCLSTWSCQLRTKPKCHIALSQQLPAGMSPNRHVWPSHRADREGSLSAHKWRCRNASLLLTQRLRRCITLRLLTIISKQVIACPFGCEIFADTELSIIRACHRLPSWSTAWWIQRVLQEAVLFRFRCSHQVAYLMIAMHILLLCVWTVNNIFLSRYWIWRSHIS